MKMGFREKASYVLQKSNDSKDDNLKVNEEFLESEVGSDKAVEQPPIKDEDTLDQITNTDSIYIGDRLEHENSKMPDYISGLSSLTSFIKLLEKDFEDKSSITYSDATNILTKLLRKLNELFGVGMASILINNADNNLESCSTIGFTGNENKKFILSKSDKQLREFFYKCDTTFIDGYKNNNEISNGLADNMTNVRFFLLLPMVVQGHFFGALNILSLEDQSVEKLSSKEVEVFSIISFLFSSILYRLIGHLSSIDEQDKG